MQGVTLIFALIACLLVITLRPQYALAAYITALLWYPSFLAVSVGTVDIVVGRFVVMVLLIRCILDDELRSKFVWSRLDTFVTISAAVSVVTYFINQDKPVMVTVESRGGHLMDTWCAYLAARFIITDRTRLVSLIKCISIVLVPLAALGVVECVTGWRLFAPLWRYSPWFGAQGSGQFVSEGRFGLNRAVGPFSHSILFGGGFAMFIPLIYYLRHEKREWHSLAYILSGVALVGALSSLSSGPWVTVLVVVFCLAMEGHKKWMKPLFAFALFSCIFIAIASNRPFYHVIASQANPLGGAGWHRAKLIDLAIENFDEWWMVGYGDRDPGWHSALGMTWTDVTNEYILSGVRYGILGVLALLAVLTEAFRRLAATHKRVTQPVSKSLCWVFGSMLFAVAVTWMSVSFFGQLMTLFYCCLGIIGSLSSPRFDWQDTRRITVLKRHAAGSVSAGTDSS
jgi:hypothetical protein